MKKLFMAIFVPILVILGTPALVATLMYDGTGDEHMPVDLYTEDADAKEMLFTELNNSITDVENGTTEDVYFNIHEDIINVAIYEYFKGENPDYAPGPDCETDNECYVYAQAQQVEGYNLSLRLVGAWVSFYEGASSVDPGRFVFNVFLEVDISNDVTYKTVLEVHFLFEDDPDYYYLEFDKVQLGRLPVPKSLISSIVSMVDEQANLNLENELSDLPMGDFNLENISYTIPKDDILEQISANSDGADAGSKLAQELLSITFDQKLVEFYIENEEFVVEAGISQLENEDPVNFPEYLYDLHDKEVVNGEVVIGEYNPELFNPDEHLQDLFTDYIFNSSLTDDSGFKIRERVFNKLIYSSQNGFTEMRSVKEIQISDTETKEIEFGLKGLWFEIEETEIYANALFKIGEIDSLLVIRAEEVSATPTELQLEFVEITVGKDADETNLEYLEVVDLEVFKSVFADIGDVEFGEFNADGDLIISTARLTALMEDGTNTGVVEVTSIDLATNAIVLEVTSQYDNVLASFQTALEDAVSDPQLLTNLDTVLDQNDGGSQEAVYDSVQNIQASLTSSEDVNPEDVETLVNNLQNLDPATQEAVLDSFTTLIDSSTVSSFEDLFGELDGSADDTTQ